MLQELRLPKIDLCGKKNTLEDSPPNELIGIYVKLEGDNHTWCNKEVSKLGQYREGNERNRTNHGEMDLESVVERPDGSKNVPYSPFVFSGHEIFITPF